MRSGAWTPTPRQGQTGKNASPVASGLAAEHVLQVERGEQERTEQHRGGGEHHQEPTADRAIGQPLHPQQRHRDPPLSEPNATSPASAGGDQSNGLGRGPAGALRLRERVHKCGDARRREQRAAQIEPPPVRPGRYRLGSPGPRRPRRPAPIGRLMKKISAPVDQLREQTAQEHADRRAGSADSAPDAECACALVALELRS